MVFRGTYQHTLDAKHRLTVPVRFREDFESGVVIVKGVDPCVELWRPAEYEAHVSTATSDLHAMSPEMRAMLRLMQGSAFDTALDKVGRVGLTAQLLAHGALTKDVVLVGVGRCLELWDRAVWERQEAGLPATVGTYTAAASHAPQSVPHAAPALPAS